MTNPNQALPVHRRNVARNSGLAVFLGLGALLGLPPRTGRLQSHGAPCAGFAEARERFARLAALDGPEVNPVCRSMLLDQGGAADSAVVLLHGMTNCPLQFKAFGEALQQRGHNVLIPRLPRNGLADRRTAELGRLNVAELVAFSDEVVDIACGLGRRVTVLGLSAGGTLAAWMAQERADVARAVIVAPFFGISTLALVYQAMIRNACLRIPNIMIDDNPEEAARKPAHSYIRKATRSFGAMMLTAEYVLRQAQRRPPSAGDVVLIANAADFVVNRQLIDLLAERWKLHDPSRVTQFDFSADDKLGHDVIDPLQPFARVEYVYPILMDYVEKT